MAGRRMLGWFSWQFVVASALAFIATVDIKAVGRVGLIVLSWARWCLLLLFFQRDIPAYV